MRKFPSKYHLGGSNLQYFIASRINNEENNKEVWDRRDW